MAILSLKWCFEYPLSNGPKSPCLEEHMNFGDLKPSQDNPTLSRGEEGRSSFNFRREEAPSPLPTLFYSPSLLSPHCRQTHA